MDDDEISGMSRVTGRVTTHAELWSDGDGAHDTLAHPFIRDAECADGDDETEETRSLEPLPELGSDRHGWNEAKV